MARIAGVNIPVNKRAEIGLTYIFGIGCSTAREILAEWMVSPDNPFFARAAEPFPALRVRSASSRSAAT